LPKAARPKARTPRPRAEPSPIRYAVVGLGWIAQSAVLPAFENARRNSKLAALVSDDPVKLRKLGAKYGVEARYGYDSYERCLREVDAVYLALPNTMHREYTERAALSGVHVLCEKPMAMTAADCASMIASCREADVKLMVAYRLHFEKANLEAIETVQAGKLGEPRVFHSLFTQDVEAGNLRLRRGEGGPLYDIGIYCLNAVRHLFRAEPEQVYGRHKHGVDERFVEVPEATAVLMRFPGERLATFTCSFGAASAGWYEIVGTRGSLRLDPAYGIAQQLVHHLTREGKTKKRRFAARDQFAPELLYFSECISSGREPEPSGEEGLADVRVLEAIEQSAREDRPIALEPFERRTRPDREQEITRPLPGKPMLVHAGDPTPE
jgi:predicted dehydrogenase